jgi:hypothetical protein
VASDFRATISVSYGSARIEDPVVITDTAGLISVSATLIAYRPVGNMRLEGKVT